MKDPKEDTAAAQKSVAHYRALFDNMNSGVAVYEAERDGADFIFKDINGAGLRIGNLERDQVVGHRVTEVFPGIREMGLLDVLRRVWQTGTPAFHPSAFYHDARITHWYENHVYRLPTGEVVAVYDDITAQKKAEQALRESEERLRLATDGSNTGLWDLNLRTNEIHLSPIWKRQLGYEDHELPSRYEEWESRLHPEDRDHALSAVRAFLETPWPDFENEFRLRHRDGSYRWILAKASLIMDADGKPCRMLGSHLDITERKRNEAIQAARLRLLTFAPSHTQVEILRAALDELEELTGSRIGFCHFVDNDQKMLSLQTWSTHTLNTCTAEGVNHHYPLTQAGVWADCVRERRPVIHNDYASLPHRKGLPPGHVAVTRQVLVPVMRDGLITAVVGLGNKDTDYTADDVHTVSQLADLVWDIAARERAAAELRQSEARFRALADHTPDHVFMQDLDLRYTLVINPQLGLTEADMLGKTDAEFLSPADAAKLTAIKRKVLATGETVSTTLSLNNAAGETEHVEGNYVPNLDAAGRVVGLIGYFRNITVRRQTEERLQESEANFHSFFDTVGEMVFVASPEGRIIHANGIAQQKLGYTLVELARMSIVDLHPAARSAEVRAILAAMFRGEQDRCLIPLRSKEGRSIPVETRVMRSQWNRRDCIIGLSRDLTAEQEAQERFENMFRNNPAPMALSTVPEGRFIDVNEAFQRAFGYAPEEVAGRTPSEVNMFVNPEALAATLRVLLTEGRIRDVELQVRGRDGALFAGLFSGELITFQGRSYCLTVMIDITARKRDAMALEASEGRFRALLGNVASIAVQGYNDRGEVTFWNDASVRLYGYTREEAMGRHLTDLIIPPDLRDFVKAAMERMLETHQPPPPSELNLMRKDGSLVPVFSSHALTEVPGRGIELYCMDIDLTERRLAEERLRNSEEMFRAIFKNNAAAMAVIEPDTTISMVNDAYCLLSGYTEQEVLGMSWPQQISPEDLGRLKEYNRRRLLNPKDAPDKYEFSFYRKDGVKRLGLLSVSYIERQKKLATSFVDITERKEAEESLRRSETRLRQAQTIAHIGNWEIDLAAGTMWASEEAFRLYGLVYTSPLIPLDQARQIPIAEDRPRLESALRALVASEEPYDLEFHIRRANDGEIRVMHSLARLEREAAGTPAKVVGVIQDVTELRRANEALHYERDLLHALLDNVPDTIYFKDAESHFLRINRAQAERFRLQDPAEAVGRTDFDFFDEEHGRQARADEQEIIRTGRPIIGKEEKEVWPDGHITWVSSTKVPLRDREGRVAGTLGISRDITMQKQAEALAEAARAEADAMLTLSELSRKALLNVAEDQKKTEMQLNEQLEELRRWHEATLGRETRILELKHEINRLSVQAGRPPPYPSAETDPEDDPVESPGGKA